MNKTLLIIESAGKIKKFEEILGKNYIIAASYGHIMDLDPKSMSIDIENNFTPNYIINHDKRDTVKKLIDFKKKCNRVILFTDQDLEGEMIAWCLMKALKITDYDRVTSNSITKKDILDALKKPRKLDQNMLDAQKTRRIMDRIVGYELSPLVDKHLNQKKLSAGRVQSVTARLIVDREEEIKQFLEKEMKSFYKFKAELTSKGKEFSSNVYNLDDKTENMFKGEISKIDGVENSKDFLNKCKDSEFIVEFIINKKRTQSPSCPFATAALQQEANRKYGYSGKKTMTIAQRLYEEGLITYMRTDSISLSQEAMDSIKKYIEKNYGQKYYKKVDYKTKSKSAQEAHEAIRPSDIDYKDLNMEKHSNKIGPDELKLYNLIWKRTVASQMKPAEFDVTQIQIKITKDNDHFLSTILENLSFDGYLKVYDIQENKEEQDETTDENDINKNIVVPKKGDKLKLIKITGTQDFVKPPGRYSEASLIDKLDKLSISRPATLATIIEKIKERHYVEKKDVDGIKKEVINLELNGPDGNKTIKEKKSTIEICKEKNKFIPTYLGIMVTTFLKMNFSEIMDYKFTANLEEQLDKISEGKEKWLNVLKKFYDTFHPKVVSNNSINSLVSDKFTRILGIQPVTGYEVFATMAKFGPVIKINCTKGKPLYAPIKNPLTLENITLTDALKLFEYPKKIGVFQKKQILLQKGTYGFYLCFDDKKISVEDENINLEKAIEKIKEKDKACIKEFKIDDKIYTILNGPYGYYLLVQNKKKKYTISIPKNIEISTIDLEKIQDILNIKKNWNNKKDTIKKETNNNNNNNNNIKNDSVIQKNIKKITGKKKQSSIGTTKTIVKKKN